MPSTNWERPTWQWHTPITDSRIHATPFMLTYHKTMQNWNRYKIGIDRSNHQDSSIVASTDKEALISRPVQIQKTPRCLPLERLHKFFSNCCGSFFLWMLESNFRVGCQSTCFIWWSCFKTSESEENQQTTQMICIKETEGRHWNVHR